MGRERYADRYDLVGSLRAIDRQIPYPEPQYVRSQYGPEQTSRSHAVDYRRTSSGGYSNPVGRERFSHISSNGFAPVQHGSPSYHEFYASHVYGHWFNKEDHTAVIVMLPPMRSLADRRAAVEQKAGMKRATIMVCSRVIMSRTTTRPGYITRETASITRVIATITEKPIDTKSPQMITRVVVVSIRAGSQTSTRMNTTSIKRRDRVSTRIAMAPMKTRNRLRT
ncbi:hypothetical protein F5B17DRAFT_393897, partial [Nemania serpens]